VSEDGTARQETIRRVISDDDDESENDLFDNGDDDDEDEEENETIYFRRSSRANSHVNYSEKEKRPRNNSSSNSNNPINQRSRKEKLPAYGSCTFTWLDENNIRQRCEFGFPSPMSETLHAPAHDYDDREWCCSLCKAQFTQKAHTETHFKRCHPKLNIERRRLGLPPAKALLVDDDNSSPLINKRKRNSNEMENKFKSPPTTKRQSKRINDDDDDNSSDNDEENISDADDDEDENENGEDAELNTNKNYQKEMKIIRTKSFPIHCPYEWFDKHNKQQQCEYYLPNMGGTRRHLAAHYNRDKQYLCSHCGWRAPYRHLIENVHLKLCHKKLDESLPSNERGRFIYVGESREVQEEINHKSSKNNNNNNNNKKATQTKSTQSNKKQKSHHNDNNDNNNNNTNKVKKQNNDNPKPPKPLSTTGRCPYKWIDENNIEQQCEYKLNKLTAETHSSAHYNRDKDWQCSHCGSRADLEYRIVIHSKGCHKLLDTTLPKEKRSQPIYVGDDNGNDNADDDDDEDDENEQEETKDDSRDHQTFSITSSATSNEKSATNEINDSADTSSGLNDSSNLSVEDDDEDIVMQPTGANSDEDDFVQPPINNVANSRHSSISPVKNGSHNQNDKNDNSRSSNRSAAKNSDFNSSNSSHQNSTSSSSSSSSIPFNLTNELIEIDKLQLLVKQQKMIFNNIKLEQKEILKMRDFIQHQLIADELKLSKLQKELEKKIKKLTDYNLSKDIARIEELTRQEKLINKKQSEIEEKQREIENQKLKLFQEKEEITKRIFKQKTQKK